jgi:hydrogenase/urease accessory protein HupE
MNIRLLVTLALATAAGSAVAHTGHGHDDFSHLHGLWHALTEPDHLLMLGAGLLVVRFAAPRVQRGLRALRQRLAQRRSGTRTQE